MGLALLLTSVAKPASASRLVASAVPTVATVRRGISAAARAVARQRPMYAAVTGHIAMRGTYASGGRAWTGTSAAQILLARHM